jgi:hypothetical protein
VTGARRAARGQAPSAAGGLGEEELAELALLADSERQQGAGDAARAGVEPQIGDVGVGRDDGLPIRESARCDREHPTQGRVEERVVARRPMLSFEPQRYWRRKT